VSFTLDPEVAEAFAPFAAEAAGSTPPPVGDVATRRATFGGIFGYDNTAQRFQDDVTITEAPVTSTVPVVAVIGCPATSTSR
jgi:hypothetical protein